MQTKQSWNLHLVFNIISFNKKLFGLKNWPIPRYEKRSLPVYVPTPKKILSIRV